MVSKLLAYPFFIVTLFAATNITFTATTPQEKEPAGNIMNSYNSFDNKMSPTITTNVNNLNYLVNNFAGLC